MANEKCMPRLTRQKHLGLLASCALVSLIAAPGLANAADGWTVIQGSGAALHRLVNGQSLPLRAGDVVAEGESVQTGPDGHLVLRHHDHADIMTVNPGSQFRIPDARREGTLANVVENMGSLLFNIEHTPGRRFEVDGPYLAAVVKGTSFTVEVAPSGNTVNVSQGAVEVQSRDSHQAALVRPGQFAMVSASGNHQLSLGARQGSAAPAPGRAGQSSSGNRTQSGQVSSTTIGDTHLDIGALTHNLVINAAPGAAAAVSGHTNAGMIAGGPSLAATNGAGHSGNGLGLGLSGAAPGNSVAGSTPPGLAGLMSGQSSTGQQGSSGNGAATSGAAPGNSAAVSTPPGLIGTPPGLIGLTPGQSSTGQHGSSSDGQDNAEGHANGNDQGNGNGNGNGKTKGNGNGNGKS